MFLIPKSYKPSEAKKIVRRTYGLCPIKLRSQWDLPSLPPDTVICDWFWQVRYLGTREGIFYTVTAIIEWGQREYNDPWDKETLKYLLYEYAEAIEDLYFNLEIFEA